MLSRENALELARVQQRYEWKRTFEMIEQFKQAVLAHGHSDLVRDIERFSERFEMVRDVDRVQEATPEHFNQV